MDSDKDDRVLTLTDFSIRISADHIKFADPRSFSQLSTSFIAYRCQGILHALLVAWPPHFNMVYLGFLSQRIWLWQSCFACLYGIISLNIQPLYLSMSNRLNCRIWFLKMVGVSGFEPETSSLSGTRSNQLSYTPNSSISLVEPKGFEPLTSCLQSRCSSQLS